MPVAFETKDSDMKDMKVAISVIFSFHCTVFPLFSMHVCCLCRFVRIVSHGTMSTMCFHSTTLVINAKKSNVWTAPYVMSSLICSVAVDNSKYSDHWTLRLTNQKCIPESRVIYFFLIKTHMLLIIWNILNLSSQDICINPGLLPFEWLAG